MVALGPPSVEVSTATTGRRGKGRTYMDVLAKQSRETQIVIGGGLLYLLFSFFHWQSASASAAGFSISVHRSEWVGIGVIAGLLAVVLLDLGSDSTASGQGRARRAVAWADLAGARRAAARVHRDHVPLAQRATQVAGLGRACPIDRHRCRGMAARTGRRRPDARHVDDADVVDVDHRAAADLELASAPPPPAAPASSEDPPAV